jgi:adenylate kinase family enzyme
MKIYIVGPVASGKSTLARKLSSSLNIPYQSLDEVVHIPDKTHPWGNRKREAEERDKLFNSIIEQPHWVIEDVGRSFFEEGLVKADAIILLEPPARVRKYRIVKRWIKQRLGLEKCIYNPSLKMLKGMFKWSNAYDTGEDKLKERAARYGEKVVSLKNDKAIEDYLRNVNNK